MFRSPLTICIVVVVSPLIALMKDQVYALNKQKSSHCVYMYIVLFFCVLPCDCVVNLNPLTPLQLLLS